ncbi:hypothetical protein IEQ34_002094 [Dendrobium chrysotoxum]|uniref:Reverse transcriptase domain-containing protein n=1 Tax=Dendrobium chrysotoxum TaxID=161865 RepID=A0AAV7HKE0_DENCH|nr:hypothetical protein IEQ34_002094 [Dendrobium chrysotoxum]
MWANKLVHETRIRIGSWNVGSLTGKLMKLIDIMIHRKINILCIHETKWVGEKAKEIDSLGFKLWHSCRSHTRNRVVGLNQGSALSPYLFALVMDVLTRHLQEDVPWCMLFADDILLIDKTREGVEVMDVLTRHLQEDVPWCMLFADDILLIDKTREGVEGKLELWRPMLESKGFCLSRSKTEYMECNFSSNRPSERIVTLGDQVINKSTRFRYLGSIVRSDGEIDGDIISRIQVRWLKWRNALDLCDRKVPLKVKGKLYKMVVRPAMLYGAECWPLKEKHNTKLSVAEMRMLRWMSGFTLRDRIRNEHIREKVGVAPVEDKIRESRLRWFVHIKRRPSDDPVRKVEGEFNSGKSTVINALLGRRYLKEGVVPTTNEITLLCYSKTDSNKQERCERNPDGQFICYLSSPILKNMNLVDTPGTNVILQRQQRLTEEFVPRADLVLFVLSSDRPLTESEVKDAEFIFGLLDNVVEEVEKHLVVQLVSFLLYVQQWKKKVVFVLNKLDLYQNASELEEATAFIKENTLKLLGIADLRFYPVSARSALEAKLCALSFSAQNYEELLYNDPRWIASRFQELERFLFSFLDGSTDTGMERMKIKLETPVAIAERLLDSAERLLLQQHDKASQELISIKEVVSSIKVYSMKMESDGISWKKRVVYMIEAAAAQAVKLMEFTLQLSNIDLITTYAFKGEKSSPIASTSTLQNEIISPFLSDVQRLLGEYSEWLQSKIVCEGELCLDRLQKQCNNELNIGDVTQSKTVGFLEHGKELSIKVMDNFSASAATKLFEQEIRDIVFGTVGGLGAAGLSASLLTSVLPTTLEDLLALSLCSAGGRERVGVRVRHVFAEFRSSLAKKRDVLEGEIEQLKARVEEKYSGVEGRLSTIENRFGNFEEMMKKILEMQSKTSPMIPRVEP